MTPKDIATVQQVSTQVDAGNGLVGIIGEEVDPRTLDGTGQRLRLTMKVEDAMALLMQLQSCQERYGWPLPSADLVRHTLPPEQDRH